MYQYRCGENAPFTVITHMLAQQFRCWRDPLPENGKVFPFRLAALGASEILQVLHQAGSPGRRDIVSFCAHIQKAECVDDVVETYW